MNWVEQCNHWKVKWQDRDKIPIAEGKLSIYHVMEMLNKHTSNKHIIMTDAGSPSYVCPVALKSKLHQRFIFNPSQADMGWAIPAAVGVSMSAKSNIVIAVVGDGSFMTNMQEIATIVANKLPIKILVLNNSGYLSIRNTQSKFFNGRVHGVDSTTGLMFPDIKKIAKAFAIQYYKVDSVNEKYFDKMISLESPAIIEFSCLENEEIIPAQAFKQSGDKRIQAGLEDMYPFLSTEEIQSETPK